jgi:hypothetical protein
LLRGTQIRARLLSTNYQHIISIEPGKRAIRHMRIAVADVLGWLAAGQSHQQILDDFLNRPRRTSGLAWPMPPTVRGD